jgi:Zn-dependent peptidase ImmA (M78 family)/transcriptional regulator with XRE-family HTH domain
MTRVQTKPELLRWARERAGLRIEQLASRFPKLEQWERNEAQPTLKQLEKYAKTTYAPIGYFFLAEPPVERIPIPDFRTISSQRITRPSPNLLEMVYLCQQRQAWYRDYAKLTGSTAPPFIGSVTLESAVEDVADVIRRVLHFDLDARHDCPTWTDALRHFIAQADDLGVMVMCSGVVLNNNKRRLDPNEFRGFAMVDELAPLVFVNGADTKAAQMFTLAHELAHLWLGQSALSNADASMVPDNAVERWCNRVAAELLVPLQVLRTEFDERVDLAQEVRRLARRFKVSTLVVLRRIHDIGGLSREEFQRAYNAELKKLKELPKGTGGDFYLTQAARVSKRFARALVESTLEGQTLYRDAFRMLGISKVETFHELGRNLRFSI